MWGSDWPVLDLNGDYAALAFAGDTRLLASLSDGEREAVFGGNAAAFYRLDLANPTCQKPIQLES